MQVLPYTYELSAPWDAFVRASKNGPFLFLRGYMDYHADRFPDASLVITDGDATWLAVLPATRAGDIVSTHAGLTYGGFVTNARMTTARMLEVFTATRDHLRACGVTRVIYKTVPSIYHRYPAEEDHYALFRADARLHRRDVLSVLRPRDHLAFQERRRRSIKKAVQAGVEVRESHDREAFWTILETTLQERHDARPVHTLAEIELLTGRFPESIRLFGAYAAGELVAGVLIYETAMVAHAQYIAASHPGRSCGALDLLFDYLIHTVYGEKPYFDFGISNEDAGRTLNLGLIEQKEGFGARAIVHDHYEWNLLT